MAGRVTAEDLAFAADWLRAYEPAPDDDSGERAERVAEWLDAEVSRREVAAFDRLARKVRDGATRRR
jgi:hypothetical protein